MPLAVAASKTTAAVAADGEESPGPHGPRGQRSIKQVVMGSWTLHWMVFSRRWRPMNPNHIQYTCHIKVPSQNDHSSRSSQRMHSELWWRSSHLCILQGPKFGLNRQDPDKFMESRFIIMFSKWVLSYCFWKPNCSFFNHLSVENYWNITLDSRKVSVACRIGGTVGLAGVSSKKESGVL